MTGAAKAVTGMRAARPAWAAAGLALAFCLAGAVSPGGAAAAEQGYGAHLASYFGMTDARNGWKILQRRLPAQLKDREPLYREAVVKGRSYIRLLAGPFDTAAAAAAFCDDVRRSWDYCDVLSLADLQPVKSAAAPAKPAPSPAPAPKPKMEPKPEPPAPMPAARPAAAKPEPSTAAGTDMKAAGGEAGTKPEMAAVPAEAATGRLVFDSRALPPPPEGKVRLSPQQKAIYAPLEGNWIQFDGDCRSDLMQIGEGAARRIVGGTAQPPEQCEARREGATVALFCDGGKELWFEVLTEDELVFRRSRAHGGAPYENIDQLLSRCQQG